MKIAIIGSGHIGGGLARPWKQKGHDVTFGAREPSADGEAPIADAVRGAQVVVLAMPYGALDDVLANAGDLTGKVVIDCTNAVEPGMTLKYGHTTSAAEELQKRIPGAKVFKSFNAQGAENLARPEYDGVRASNFFCGDDAESRAIVRGLVEDVGFEAIDAGPLKNARLVEPLMLLWAVTSRSLGSREIAFKVLKR
jgi:predicted dinucleotide-binding enzyme